MQTLMENDLVDVYSLTVNPLLLGGGKRLFVISTNEAPETDRFPNHEQGRPDAQLRTGVTDSPAAGLISPSGGACWD